MLIMFMVTAQCCHVDACQQRRLIKYLLSAVIFFFQIMTSRPRSDLYINLPALRKLDNMLLVSSTSILLIKHFPTD
jgi:hypothetical protein